MDGGPAVEAELYNPAGVAVDGAGNLYIADASNNGIRKVDSTGTITTIAGTGEFGFSGDGGPAVAAQLRSPRGVAVDSAGNVYIADSSNRRIRKIDSTGTITTIAGTGRLGFSGDGGPAVAAQLRSPYGVAVDGAGNLYIADASNNGIRKVDSTGTITTIAGTGESGFSGDGGPAVEAELRSPYGVAVDSAGNVYIADSSNWRIRKIDATGTITTIAGTGEFGFSGDGGPAVAAELRRPRGVAVDSAGNVYIADVGNHRIRKVDSTGTITTIAGTGEFGFSGDGGPAVEAELRSPYGVAVDSAGNVYIVDVGDHRIRKVDATGTITTIAGTGYGFSGDGGPAVAAELRDPYGVAVDSAGNVYIADSSNRRIRKVDATGTITTIAGTGESGFSGDGGPAVEAELRSPYGVAVDSAGNVYIADSSNWRIRKIDATGTITTIAGTGEYGFSGDGGPAAAARLGFPRGVAVDGDGNLYIADTGNRRIRKLTPGGGSTPPNPTAVLNAASFTPGAPYRRFDRQGTQHGKGQPKRAQKSSPCGCQRPAKFVRIVVWHVDSVSGRRSRTNGTDHRGAPVERLGLSNSRVAHSPPSISRPRGSPARAGIDLPMVKRLLAHERFPRTRGDRPPSAAQGRRGLSVPPHARG